MIDGVGLMRSASDMRAVLAAGMGPERVLQHVDASIWMERAGQNNKLITAAMWADCYPAESIDPGQLDLPGGDRSIQPGGDGTPAMARFPVSELALHLHKSTGTAERIIADGLDLRHRLPRLWERLCAYEIDGLDCQTIARRTRHLTLDQAVWVDRAVAPYVGQWSWGRMSDFLDAQIIEVDADNMAKLAEHAKQQKGVWTGQTDEYGNKTVYMRLSGPAAIFFEAQVQRIADILARRGHTGGVDERRADAVAELGNPLHALRLMAEDTAPSLFDPDPDDDSLLARPSDPRGDDVNEEAVTATGPHPFDTTDSDSSDDLEGDRTRPPQDDLVNGSEGVNKLIHQDDAESCDAEDGCGNAGLVRFPRLDHDRRLAEAALQAVKAIDPAKLLPQATLFVHVALETVSDGLGVTRVEDIGPVVSSLVAEWLQGCKITVKPVIDLNHDLDPVDAYEVPAAMRERMFLKHPASMFPFSGIVGRHALDLDHNIPYTPGIPGQTREDKLAPAGRREHNVITHGAGWSRRRPTPETELFRAPHGHIYLVNQTGSHDLGRGEYAYQLWHAAAPQTKAA